MAFFEKKIKRPVDDELEAVPTPVPVPAAPVVPPPAAAPAPVVTPSKASMKADHPDYGINKAIELMRMLPDDNVELVVRVVKTTLESTNIDVGSIINDASRKQSQIEARVGVLKESIAELEAEIATFRKEISALEADHKETSTVKDRLMLAEKLASGPARPAKATTPPMPRPTVPMPDPNK
jgi:hypothetical protein